MPINNPFPGLRPFSSKESELFFGRERHISEIVRKLKEYKFVSIVGTSGSGKSSLIRAGLLPSMEKAENPWTIAVMRPGESPVNSLVNALMGTDDLAAELPERAEVTSTLSKNKLGLVQLMRPVLTKEKRFLLLVDQFEEIFRYNQSEDDSQEADFTLDAHFVDLLLSAVEQKDVPIYVILTLRSDFLGDCEQFMGLPEAINDGQFLIPRMNKDELRSCITGPVTKAGAKISPRLIQHLVDEVGFSPDRLPVLQHTLMRTWEEWAADGDHDSPIDLQHYERTGGMDRSLNIHAEEAFADLNTDKEKRIAEILFKTITVKGSDNRGIRRPSPVSRIARIAEVSPQDVISVAQVFRQKDRGFIMPPYNVELSDESMLDISHESLMRVWNRLAEWVDEEADSAELYLRITNNALLYEEDKAGLWRDPDLQIALDWRDDRQHNEEWAKQYNDHFKLAQTFIKASYNDKQYQLAEVQRRKKLQRAAIIIFLVSLSALSVWAFTERNSSVKNAKKAIAGQQESEKQKKIAEEQKAAALKNLEKALAEEKRAQEQKMETERQRNIALQRAEEARNARLKAEVASKEANAARESAVVDRNRAQMQQQISDSLRSEAELSEQKALRLQMLSLAQTIAIKSKQAQDYTFDESVKGLLALQAYDMNKKYGGDKMDPEIFSALFLAYRAKGNPGEYVQRQHSDAIKSISFNKQLNMLASAGNDGVIMLTDISTKPLSVTQSEPVSLFFNNATFNADGSLVSLSCDNEEIRIYKTANLKDKPLILSKINDAEIMDLIWVKDLLISASLDKTIMVRNANSGQLERSFTLEARPLSMAITKDGSSVLVGCDNGVVYRIDPNTEGSPAVFLNPGKGRINGICMNANSTLFAIGTDLGYAAVYSVESPGKPLSIMSGHKAGITGVTFHPSKNYLATSSLDKVVRLWNVDELNPNPIEFREHDNWVLDVAFNGTGDYLASAGKDETIRIYPIDINFIAEELRQKLNRKLTQQEWLKYGSDEVLYDSIIN